MIRSLSCSPTLNKSNTTPTETNQLFYPLYLKQLTTDDIPTIDLTSPRFLYNFFSKTLVMVRLMIKNNSSGEI